jgi:eukaryotic-like serine/threonine-protein kinase
MSHSSLHQTDVIEADAVSRELSQAHDTIYPRSATPPIISVAQTQRTIRDAIPDESLPACERYDLHTEVGRGGMAIVYRAYDRVLSREVIVKLMRPELRSSRSAERRFLREARIVGQLHHAGIVPLYDAGRFADGRPFLTMKLAEGRTLDRILQDRTQITPENLLPLFPIFEQILETMAYTHHRGIIHRDLKPLNVVVSSTGHVRVLDWGLAKILASVEDSRMDDTQEVPMALPFDGLHQTAFGAALGTPAFMSPEQANGHHESIDERCDVFALGAILCWMLTGAVPYSTTNSRELWRMAKSGDLVDTIRRLSYVEPRLRRLTMRWLAPDRADRPANAAIALQEWHAARRQFTGWRLWLRRLLK